MQGSHMTLNTDDTGGLLYSPTRLDYIDGVHGVFQDLATRLKLLKNEYKLQDEGIDYPAVLTVIDNSQLLTTLQTEVTKDSRVVYSDIIAYRPFRSDCDLNIDIYLKTR